MTVGYAAFQTNLNIKGTSSISSNWDIIISNIEKISYGGEAEEAKAPTGIGSLTADMEVNLYQKGDYIEYDVTVLNRGTIDAVLSNITPAEREYIDSNNEAIKISFSGVNINDKLLKGDTHKLKVRIEYNPEFTGTPKEGSVSLEIGLEYTQAEMAGVPTINPNLYVSSNGDDTKGNGSKSNPYLTLSKAYTEASDNSTIYIMDDITQTETLNLNEDKNITLTSYGTRHSIIRGNNLINYVIHQQAGTLNLENIILDGNNVETNTAIMRVNNQAILNNGSLIKNGQSNLDNPNNSEDTYCGVDGGGGVTISSSGTLIMNAGEISNNIAGRGGGIYNHGQLIINSGKIKNNSANLGTGGVQNCGYLEMNGGEISYNAAPSSGGIANLNNAVLNSGSINNNITTKHSGGIGNYGELIINDGVRIYSNESKDGGGISNMDAYHEKYIGNINMIGGTISNNVATGYGGGIANQYGTNNKVTIKNGNIFGNTSEAGGGGIYNHAFLHIISANIYNNTSVSGGGILNYMILNIDGGEIYSNNAQKNGGGISGGSESQIIMTGGVIRNNIAPLGGGITVYAQTNYTSSFTLKGGTIKDNISTSSHGGIYVSGVGSYTRVSGIVCGNKPTNSYETHTTCPAS